MTFGDRVLERREELRMSQTALSKAVKAHGGSLSQSQISALEAGTTGRPRALPELAAALRTTQEWLLYGTGQKVAPSIQNDRNKSFKNNGDTSHEVAAAPDPLLIWRSTPSADRVGETMVFQERAGAVVRPADLAYSKDAFAFRIIDDEAEPNYERRDTLLIDPASAPAPGDHCFLVRDPTTRPYSGVVRRLIRITPESWITRKFAPGSPEISLSRAEWKAVWPIFGKYNRR